MPLILSTPGDLSSVHDDLLFTVIDAAKANDPVTYPDYRYICDVYNGADLVARLKAYPQPDSKIGVFNISNILRNYVSPVLDPDPNVFQCQNMGIGEFNVSGTCIFGEEYGFTQFLNVSGDTGRTYYGHYNGRLIGTYTNMGNATNQFSSEKPRRWPMPRDVKFFFLPYFKAPDDFTITIEFFNCEGVSIGSGDTGVITGFDGEMLTFNIANPGISEIMPGGIPANACYMTVSYGSENIYTVDLICEAKYTIHTLHFLNRYGGWESKEFIKLSRKSISLEKSDHGKLAYGLSGAGLPEYYSANKVYRESRAVYAVQYSEKMTLNSNNLSNDEYIWLADLILSPMVYIEMYDGDDVYFIPAVIVVSDYEIKKGVNDKTSNLTINIEFGERFNAQYR